MLKVGIVGLGWWGKQLLDYFRNSEGVKVTSTWSRNPQRAKEVELKDANFYTDMEEMFEKEKMDAVVIATAPMAHLLPTRLAAERGIHVFCEKPMATSLKDCDEMIEVTKENNVKLMIAFKHRFSKAFRYIKQNLPAFGKPLWAVYTYPLWKVDDPGWKFLQQDGTQGIVIENVVHAIDGLIYLMGDVDRVYAEGNGVVFKCPPFSDSVTFTLRFKNGAIAAIGGGCTSEQRISREYLDIHYEKALAQIWGKLDYPFNLKLLWRGEDTAEEHKFKGSDGVKEEVRHFIKCIKEDKEPLCDGIEGRKSLEVAMAVNDSIKNNKVVNLN